MQEAAIAKEAARRAVREARVQSLQVRFPAAMCLLLRAAQQTGQATCHACTSVNVIASQQLFLHAQPLIH